jgi:periplasmic divalent cation tolerance protein
MAQGVPLSEHCLVLVSASSEAEAAMIANTLVQEKLAACVSVLAATSTYHWQGELHCDPEWQLMIKTTGACFEQLQARVMELHSYEVPEMIALPIVAGSAAYLSWLRASVSP